MTVHHPHLRKALCLTQLNGSALDGELRADIRNALRREVGEAAGGGDFHGPFWSDAKRSAFDELSLPQATESRIERSRQRQRLYPLLQAGFLAWWRPFRAQRNEPLRPFREELRGCFELPNSGIEIKVHSLLSLSAGDSFHRFIYPYFTEDPALGEEWAAYGLAALTNAFPEFDEDCFVLLDVLRGHAWTYSNCTVPDDSLAQFDARYQHVLNRWSELRRDYV